VASYPRCSISPKQKLVHSCFPYQDLVSTIDPLVYPMGEWEPLLPPMVLSDLEFPFKSDLIVCRSSSPHACDSLLIDSSSPCQNPHRHMEYGQFFSPFGIFNPPHSCYFSYFEFPSDEAILEAITMVSIPWEYLYHGLFFISFWDTFEVVNRRASWS
jgi:hypothetical protein